MNPLGHKPFKNSFAGKDVKTKQHFKPNSNLSGYSKGTDVTVKGNKLAMPVTRTGSSTGKLVKRTYTDASPGLQGGLRETVGILEEINEFCSASLQEMGFRGTAKDNFEAPERGVGLSPFHDGFNDLIVRIRHARKTGDKAKEAMAKDELERLAIRHNKMKDPEVLDALS